MTRFRSLRARLAFFFGAAVAVAIVLFAATATVVIIVGDRAEEAARPAGHDPDEGTNDTLERMLLAMAIAAPVAVGGAAALGWWLARRSLAPMREATERAAAARQADLRMALPLRGTGDEWDELAGTMNALLSDAHRSMERIRAFTSDAAHEMRTPLTVVIGEADVSLRKNRTPAAYRKSLSEIRAEAGRLAQLVDRLLLLARADADALAEHRETVDAGLLLREAANRVEHLARASKKKIQIVLSDEACPVSVDRLLIVRALENLLENAVRHGGRAISVSASRLDRSVVIEVSDDGPGISPTLVPRLFDRFVRGDPARSGSGFGLGLSIARSIAEAHGGTLSLVPSPRGARFRLSLG